MKKLVKPLKINKVLIWRGKNENRISGKKLVKTLKINKLCIWRGKLNLRWKTRQNAKNKQTLELKGKLDFFFLFFSNSVIDKWKNLRHFFNRCERELITEMMTLVKTNSNTIYRHDSNSGKWLNSWVLRVALLLSPSKQAKQRRLLHSGSPAFTFALLNKLGASVARALSLLTCGFRGLPLLVFFRPEKTKKE